MWELSDSEKKTVREFLVWLFRESLDYDIVRFVPDDTHLVLDEDAVLAAYVRWREVLSEQD